MDGDMPKPAPSGDMPKPAPSGDAAAAPEDKHMPMPEDDDESAGSYYAEDDMSATASDVEGDMSELFPEASDVEGDIAEASDVEGDIAEASDVEGDDDFDMMSIETPDVSSEYDADVEDALSAMSDYSSDYDG